MMKYFDSKKLLWKEVSVLEVGCGIGLLGIALIKKILPKSYTFSDHHPGVLQSLKENLSINLFHANSNDTTIMHVSFVLFFNCTDFSLILLFQLSQFPFILFISMVQSKDSAYIIR